MAARLKLGAAVDKKESDLQEDEREEAPIIRNRPPLDTKQATKGVGGRYIVNEDGVRTER